MSAWMIVALAAIGCLVYLLGFSVGSLWAKSLQERPVTSPTLPEGLPQLSVDAVDLLEIGLINQDQFNQLLSRRAKA